VNAAPPTAAHSAATLRAVIARHGELLAALDAGRAVDPATLRLVAEHADCLDLVVEVSE